MRQEKLRKSTHQDHGSADARQDDQTLQTEKETKDRKTQKLIVEVAERLFRQIGFQKTTVADIARELHMSPANVYRFFGKKSAINEAVCIDLLGKIEAEGEEIAASSDTAAQRMRDLIGSLETTHHKQYMRDRKLYELIEAAVNENWATTRRHTERMTKILEQIIASGMASGEFSAGDPTLAARLVNTACIRFRDPRLIVEYKQEPEPSIDQMIDFCIQAM
jgi:AcrR family transcriptional regulator